MVEIQNNIVSNLIFQSNLKAIQEANSNIKTLASTTKSSTGDIKKAFQQTNTQIDMQNRLNVANELMRKTGLTAESLNRGLKNQGMILQKTGEMTDLFGNKIKVADINLGKLRKSAWRFNMNMLTLMFGFMALQRILTQFGRSVLTTFQKANEDTQGLGKATWELQAAWEFFKYSLVDALTQSGLFQWLVDVLLQVVQLFNKLNPTAKAIIAWGTAILFVISTVGVLFAVFQPLFSFLWTWIPYLSQLLIGVFGASLWWLVALVALVVGLWISDFGGFQEFIKKTLGISLFLFKTIFTDIWKIVKTIMDLIVAIFKGDFDKVDELGKKFLDQFKILFLKVMIGIAAIVENIFSFMANSVLDALQFILNGTVYMLNQLIKLINKIPGVNIPIIPKVDLSGMKAAYVTLEEVQSRFDGINKMMGLSEAINTSVPTTQEKTQSVQNLDMSGMTLNLSGVSEEVMGDTDKLVDLLSGRVMNILTEKLNRNVDSNTE